MAGRSVSARAWSLLRDATAQFFADKCPRLAAALSYYTLLSLAPMLYLVLLVASLAFEGETARNALVQQVSANAGDDVAQLVRQALDAADGGAGGVLGTLAGLGLLLLAATSVFGELQAALNQVWGLQAPRGKPFLRIVRERLLSVLVVLLLGLFLVASLAANAVLTFVFRVGGSGIWQLLYPVADFAVSLAILTMLVAAIYKILPDATVHWRDVFGGALFTALLLAIGKLAIGLYIGRTAAGSAYGAAGALAALLVWVYMSGLIFLFGAEMTEIHAAHQGRIKPRRGAIRVLPQRIPLAEEGLDGPRNTGRR